MLQYDTSVCAVELRRSKQGIRCGAVDVGGGTQWTGGFAEQTGQSSYAILIAVWKSMSV